MKAMESDQKEHCVCFKECLVSIAAEASFLSRAFLPIAAAELLTAFSSKEVGQWRIKNP